MPGVSADKLKQAAGKAAGAADVLLLTDAPLLFHPGQLALAALRSGMKSVSHSPCPVKSTPWQTPHSIWSNA